MSRTREWLSYGGRAGAWGRGSGGRRWFRTGDQGAFDDESYLTLSGRLKEIINVAASATEAAELGQITSTPTRTLNTVLALAAVRAKTAGPY